MSSSSEQARTALQIPLQGLNTLMLEQMSNEDFWEYARQRAHALPVAPAHAEYLECKLHGKNCLIALSDLAEVLAPPYRLARLPNMPAWMAGIMSWRGQTIAVVDLARYLLTEQQQPGPWQAEGTLLVAEQAHLTLGLLVPALGFASTIDFANILPLTSLTTGFTFKDADGIVEGSYADLPILNISSLLTGLVQQIGMAAKRYG